MAFWFGRGVQFTSLEIPTQLDISIVIYIYIIPYLALALHWEMRLGKFLVQALYVPYPSQF